MIKSFFNINNIEYNENISLKKYNTYRIDTLCEYLVYPKNTEELIKVLTFIKNNNIKYLVLGNGSNIILSMDKFEGIIIKLDYFNEVSYHDDNLLTVGAGCSLPKIAQETIDKGYDSFAFAAGIPGMVGASTAMNAGAYNQDLAAIIKEVKVLTNNLEIITMTKEELNFSYRDSFFKHHNEYYVLSTTFELHQGNIEETKELVNTRRQKRIAFQPLDMPSAGSVFRNPESMYAGELIEKSNLKGYCIGDAMVSEKHANFIVNKGNATGKEIVELIQKIKKEVKNNYNIDLKLEQIIIE